MKYIYGSIRAGEQPYLSPKKEIRAINRDKTVYEKLLAVPGYSLVRLLAVKRGIPFQQAAQIVCQFHPSLAQQVGTIDPGMKSFLFPKNFLRE